MTQAGGLKKLVGDNLEGIDAREVNSLRMFDDSEGRGVVVRVGRYGPYLERMIIGDEGEEKSQRANLPDDLPPDELDLALAEELFSTPQEGRSLGTDPESGHEILAKEGRFGPYVTEVLPEGAKEKPRTGSLFASMTLSEITIDDAMKLLSLPRVVGKDPETGEEITAQNGRYGPYIKKDKDSRSLDSEDKLFTVTLEEAQKIFAQPKQRGAGRREAAAEGAGQGPGVGRADGGQGRPLRPVRHRRHRLQRLAAQGRRRRDADRRAGLRAPRREAGQGAGAEEDDHALHGARSRRPPRRRPPTAKKTTSTAKKAPAKKPTTRKSPTT